MEEGHENASFEYSHEIVQDVMQFEMDEEVEVCFYSDGPQMVVESTQNCLRRSLSMGNLPLIDNQAEEHSAIHEISTDLLNLQISTDVKKERKAVKRMSRSVSKDNLYKLAQPKLSRNEHANRFVSMSEAINKFYSKTPERFHSKSREHLFHSKVHKNVVECTIPQSPNLATKSRARPVLVPTTKELEEKEIEKLRKYKIKANPLNPKILQGPIKPVHIDKKPSTVVEPFRLTQPQSKKEIKAPETDVFEFRANPMPKSVYARPRSTPKSCAVTVPRTPRFTSRFGSAERIKTEVEKAEKNAQQKPFKPTRTQPVPFSFEQRDVGVKKKRADLINKVLEEEKKARKFQAKPAPTYVLNKTRNGSMTSIRSSKSEDDCSPEVPVFKAKLPTVLYKKPFEPKKAEVPLTEITEFHLNSDRRAKERKEFERELRGKNEKILEWKKKAQEEEERHKLEELAELRKKTEYKAKPIRHFKELVILPAGKVTVPISPNFHTDRLRNKENDCTRLEKSVSELE